MSRLYYTPPENHIFEEVREKAILLWHEVDTDNDRFGYATSKVNQIKNIGNVGDNLMFIVAMIDFENQRKFAQQLSDASRLAIRERMIDGGNPEYLITF